jgi:hypothetical protein
MDAPRKQKALELMASVDREVETAAPSDAASTRDATKTGKLMAFVVRRLNDADPTAAAKRVARLRSKQPDADNGRIVELLMKAKCRKTAAIGASTSAAAIIPGLGTALAMTIGMAVDLSSSLKSNAELVLEIAAVYGHRLSDAQRSEVILAVTGISAGADKLGGAAVQGLSKKAGELIAGKWAAKAVPAIGMAASASTNVLSTYIIGRRADAYFSRGPDALGDWQDDLRAISGVDERKIAGWLGEKGRLAGHASKAVGRGVGRRSKRYARKLTDAGEKAVGGAVATKNRLVQAAATAGSDLKRRVSRRSADDDSQPPASPPPPPPVSDPQPMAPKAPPPPPGVDGDED